MQKHRNARKIADSGVTRDCTSGAARGKRAKSRMKARVFSSFSDAPAGLTTRASEADSPAPERSHDGRIGDALTELAGRPARDQQTGRFIAGNPAHLEGLEYSQQLKAALAPLKRELIERVRGQLAADGDAPETLLGVIDMYCEARLLRSSAFVRMSQLGGFMTSKGKARALLKTWESAYDRELRAAERLGLERRARSVKSTREWLLDAHDEREQHDTDRRHDDQTATSDEMSQTADPETDTEAGDDGASAPHD